MDFRTKSDYADKEDLTLRFLQQRYNIYWAVRTRISHSHAAYNMIYMLTAIEFERGIPLCIIKSVKYIMHRQYTKYIKTRCNN